MVGADAQTADMVFMLVADDDSPDNGFRQFRRPQSAPELFEAEAGVDQDASVAAMNQHGIAAAAAAENSDS